MRKQDPMAAREQDAKLWNETRGEPVASRVFRAKSIWDLTVGLLSRPPLRHGDALWLEPCGSIHTWGMRYAIDVLFLDADHRVLRVARDVRPWQVAAAPRGTRAAVELAAGTARGVQAQDRLRLHADW